MTTVAIDPEPPVAQLLGYRCRDCGHVTGPASDRESSAPRDSRCAGCGRSVPPSREPVGLAEVERHFEPLIWWDALAA
jgi:hypothetical protein